MSPIKYPEFPTDGGLWLGPTRAADGIETIGVAVVILHSFVSPRLKLEINRHWPWQTRAIGRFATQRGAAVTVRDPS